MCGIVGIYAFGSHAHRVDSELLDRMRDKMTHRGPDGGASWVSEDRRIGLGFRRLAIIDLSTAAMQPMCNKEGLIRIVFNGEIYNFNEIRTELEETNRFHWKTDHSDTEVILHAYEQWGIDCLQKFRGMFAIAIWDGRTRDLWLVRDRIGIKPLYYSIRDGQISFASEIKALLIDPAQKRSVNEEAFFHYLSFLTTPAPQTLFDGILKLQGGSWLRINSEGQVTQHRYWDVLENIKPLTGISEEEISCQILDELRTSVHLRKVSDVPVGVFLSGGIDSSTNAALFSEGEHNPVKTFSIGYVGEYQTYKNEFTYARLVSKLVRSEHHVKSLSVDDLLDFLPQMIQLQDEPIADPVCFPIYYVSRLARENGVIVAQVGEGADELFWGYQQWKNQLYLQRIINNPAVKLFSKPAFDGFCALGKEKSIRTEYFRRALMHQPIFWGGAEAFSDIHKKKLLSKRLQDKFNSYSSWEVIGSIYARFQENAWEKQPLAWMSYLDLNLRLPELLLMRVDKMSMGVSLECRVPFLDHRFVQLAMSIPEALKTRDGKLKYILKKAVRGLIPDEIIDRPKQGFGVPIYEWFFQRLGEIAKKDLMAFCEQTNYFDLSEVIYLFDHKRYQQVWILLNFVYWWKEYIHS